MDQQLEQNLALSTVRKPIAPKQESLRFKKTPVLKDSQSSETDETLDEENRLLVATKRIRYLNPYNYYITDDVIKDFELSELIFYLPG